MPRLLAALLVLAAFSACDSGSTDQALLETTFRTSGTDWPSSAAVLPDGRLIIGGSAEGVLAPADGTNAYPLLLQIGADGSLEADRVWRDQGYGGVLEVQPRGDGFAAVVSSHNAPTEIVAFGRDALPIETLYTFPEACYSWNALAADDGWLVHCYTPGYQLQYVLALDAGGAERWRWSLADAYSVERFVPAPDGGWFVSATLSDSAYSKVVLKLDAARDEVWRWPVAQEPFADVRALVPQGDGVVAVIRRLDQGASAVAATRLSAQGETRWTRVYAEMEANDAFRSVDVQAAAALSGDRVGLAYGTDYGSGGIGAVRATVLTLGPDGEVARSWRFGPRRGTSYVSQLLERASGEVIAVGAVGPERLGGYGGDDFDVRVVFGGR
jgi:hypothetical protein